MSERPDLVIGFQTPVSMNSLQLACSIYFLSEMFCLPVVKKQLWRFGEALSAVAWIKFLRNVCTIDCGANAVVSLALGHWGKCPLSPESTSGHLQVKYFREINLYRGCAVLLAAYRKSDAHNCHWNSLSRTVCLFVPGQRHDALHCSSSSLTLRWSSAARSAATNSVPRNTSLERCSCTWMSSTSFSLSSPSSAVADAARLLRSWMIYFTLDGLAGEPESPGTEEIGESRAILLLIGKTLSFVSCECCVFYVSNESLWPETEKKRPKIGNAYMKKLHVKYILLWNQWVILWNVGLGSVISSNHHQ